MEGILKEAVRTLEQKYIPQVNMSSVHVPEDMYKQIFDMLEVWDRDREDDDVKIKTKFIYDTLKEQGNPQDLLNGIFTKLGALPLGDVKVDRVHRYLRLLSQGNKLLNQYENIKSEIHSLEKPKEEKEVIVEKTTEKTNG